MIETIPSIQFIRQLPGTYNRPIEALCREEGGGIQIYYLKYSRTSNEIDGLVAEVICHFLAKELNLPTPDISYVRIGSHAISQKIIHHEHLFEGKVVFGSRKVQNLEDELSRLDFIFSKHEFNRLEYPLHLLRIGLFDLWVGNNDRTSDNYNLFLTRGRQQKLVIFDHFEAFNKIAEHPLDKVSTDIDVFEKAFLSSSFPYEMLGWVGKEDLNRELGSFMKRVRSILAGELIGRIKETFPAEWNVKDATIRYILDFLSSEERLDLIEEQASTYIKYLPEKS